MTTTPRPAVGKRKHYFGVQRLCMPNYNAGKLCYDICKSLDSGISGFFLDQAQVIEDKESGMQAGRKAEDRSASMW